jgi:hypothetical protein
MMLARAPVSAAVCASALLALIGCKEDAPEGEGIAVPSGRTVAFLDVITNAPGTEGSTARFRFVAPDLQPGEDASVDMQALCDSYALPRISGMVPEPQQIIIVLSDRAVPFGETAPDAVQSFEAYRPQDATCMWELM